MNNPVAVDDNLGSGSGLNLSDSIIDLKASPEG